MPAIPTNSTQEINTRPHLIGPISVTAIELDVIPADKEANLRSAAASIAAQGKDSDVIVLPEMFSTGFTLDADKARSLAEKHDGPTIKWARRQAAQANAAITGSFIASENGRIYNRAFFIEPSGETTLYDKHHLFAPGGEDKIYTAGAMPPPVVRFRGWNIAFAVCYDLRFPAWLRNIGGAYDLLIMIANWPDARAYAWRQLLIARAIENQAYVAGCNRSGEDPFGSYSGTSLIIDPKGKVVATTSGEGSGRTCRASLSKTSLDDFRKKFPVYLHGDMFSIK